jgi:glycosyltransferase involved in cell wall biosynthesis
MHIGFLTPEYPHKLTGATGGLGTSIKNLATQLINNGVEVSIFIYGQKIDSKLQEEGLNFHLIKQKKYKAFGWYLYRKSLQRYLNSHICSEKIELIEAPDWTGITAFMKLKCPLVIRMNGSDGYFCHLEQRQQKWKNRFFEGTALKAADALVSVSAFTAIKTKEIFKIKDSIEVIPNSVDTEKFSPIDIPVVNNRLLYFGTVIRKKGVLELAFIFNEVVKQRPEVELLIIGKDVIDVFDKRSTLEMLKERLSAKALNNFTYIPEVGYDEILSYIAAAEVVVLPSFAEALPMTWLEAMAMEKALVTSNIGWAKEIIENGKNGYFEDPREHKAFAALIIKLISNPAELKIIGQEARKCVLDKFASEVIVEKNISFYSRLI